MPLAAPVARDGKAVLVAHEAHLHPLQLGQGALWVKVQALPARMTHVLWGTFRVRGRVTPCTRALLLAAAMECRF